MQTRLIAFQLHIELLTRNSKSKSQHLPTTFAGNFTKLQNKGNNVKVFSIVLAFIPIQNTPTLFITSASSVCVPFTRTILMVLEGDRLKFEIAS